MSDEDALIAGIRTNPLDDLRRLVYADWLDERGRSDEAEYLRLVAALAEPGTAVDVKHPHAVRLVSLAGGIDWSWRVAVGCRFDLRFDALDAAQKLWFIRCVREVSGYGLLEAKEFSESLPAALAIELPFESAVERAAAFRGVRVSRHITPSGEGSSAWSGVRSRWL